MRDILLQLDSYPEATSQEAIAQAARFAAAIGGVLSALAVQVEIRAPNNRVADYLIGLSHLARAEEQKSRRACDTMLEVFRAQAHDLGVLGDVQLGKADLYGIGDYVAKRARTRDLCIVPVADHLDGQRSIAEAVVFGSGRPVLLFRPGRADLPRGGFDKVVLAWDASRAAARAMAAALPVMRKAGEVQVLTATNEKPDARAGLGEDAVRHLKLHGVNALAVEVDASGRRIGPVLDDYVAQRESDLLIMGAYGHSKVREFILGGATEHMLHDPQTPLMLSH